MGKKTIYVFGNEHLEGDGLAREVASLLPLSFSVVHCRSPDELLEEKGEILILDVVRNIKKPMLIEDISRLKTRKMVSLHDFDVGYFLALLRELDPNQKVKIIGIPPQGDRKEIAKKVIALAGG